MVTAQWMYVIPIIDDDQKATSCAFSKYILPLNQIMLKTMYSKNKCAFCVTKKNVWKQLNTSNDQEVVKYMTLC